MRRTDSAYRYGGEEFVLILPEADIKSAAMLAERLRQGFADETVQADNGLDIRCTVSIGLAAYQSGETENQFIRRADDATYEAKRRGKNCVVAAP